MKITRDDVLKIAKLARLKFEEEELASFTGHFQTILDYVEKLNELDTDSVEPTSHVTPEVKDTPVRADAVSPSLPREEVLATAPDPVEGQFRVPKIIQ